MSKISLPEKEKPGARRVSGEGERGEESERAVKKRKGGRGDRQGVREREKKQLLHFSRHSGS